MLLLGHLGLTVLAARLLRPLLPDDDVPLGFLLAGALLPDLVDKPLGHVMLGWDNGRLWGHTLAFVVLLLALAWLRRSRSAGALGVGVLFHQLLDQVPWLEPWTWFWPLRGDFPRGVSAGPAGWIEILTSDPLAWASEAVGLAALVLLLVLPVLGSRTAWWRGPGPEPGPRRTRTEARPASEAEPPG